MAKLTVKSLAVRVAILETIIQKMSTGLSLGEEDYNDFYTNRMLFGPAVENKKVLKTLMDKQKENEKKVKKKAKKQAEKQAKSARKADKKVAKMTKTRTPEKRGKHALHTTQTNQAYEGLGNQE